LPWWQRWCLHDAPLRSIRPLHFAPNDLTNPTASPKI
jgi:hypothetical protein